MAGRLEDPSVSCYGYSVTANQEFALNKLAKHGELLCFEGAFWAEIGFERDPSKLPAVVPVRPIHTSTIKALVKMGKAKLHKHGRRVYPRK